MALSDYENSILILVLGFVYFQFFMTHHSNQHYKFQVSSDTVLFHANWTQSIEDLCCLGKVHDALALQNIKNIDLSFSMSSFNDQNILNILNLNSQKFRLYEDIKLDLSGLKLTNNGIITILKSIRNGVKNLQINLNGIQTTQGLGQAIANQLNGLKSLQNLKLSLIMSMKQNQVNSFIKNHKPSQSLQTLHLILIGNQLSKASLTHTKQYFSRLNVNQLAFNLYANKIGAEGAELLTEALKELKNLKTLNLDLYFNNITQIGTQKISQVIETMTNLTTLTLNLDFNYIKNEGAKALGKSLSKMTQLDNLNLGVASKNFGYLGFKYIINGIQKLVQLKKLFLRCGVNRVGYNGAQITKQMLAKLNNLQSLELGFLQNYIGDQGISLLAQQVALMKKLKSVSLNFGFNDAKSFGLIRVIKSFLNSKLQHLHLILSSNQFRDSQTKLIESHLSTLIKNNNKFILDFADTAVSKKQAAKLQKIFNQANSNFNKNAKISVNSIIPEQQPKSQPKKQPKKQPKVQKKVEEKVVQSKVDNNTQSIEL